jgi:GT2 family glycosyltransferase
MEIIMVDEIPALRKGSQHPVLSIIIVSWNVRELLRACLLSIDRNREDYDLEVIVVDNASDDGSPVMVSELFPWVTLIRCEENVGFPRGNNIGLERANGRYFLLLNPDTEIQPYSFKLMIEYLDRHDEVGLVGPQLLNADGSVQSSRRRFPTIATAIFESSWLEPIAPKRILRHYYVHDLPDDEPSEVDWVTGACMLTRREVLTKVGGLDEAYFMYSEELDWCRRIKDAGWQIVYLPTAQVLHHVGKSSEQAVTARHINFQQAKLRYFQKYHGPWVTAVLSFFLLLN